MTGESSGYYSDFNGIKDLALSLRDGYVYQGQYSSHRKRRHGRTPLDVRPDQLVVSAQNHDQIGNRAHGERLEHVAQSVAAEGSGRADHSVALCAAAVPGRGMGRIGTPFLYFTDHEDEQARGVARGTGAPARSLRVSAGRMKSPIRRHQAPSANPG
jgi:maltooligosyltrehalose trehalohydrolase